MVSIRNTCLLLPLVALTACASADTGERTLRAAETRKEKPVAPRRSVPALPERPPVQVAPAPAQRIVPPTVVAPVPPSPTPVTGCDPGGCWSGGNRYNGGTGGTYLDRSGRMCQSNGTWMQCF